tara:strand:+ start:110 stop:292 length:183 start_codon:yes stop_codon:yes gene_type:complete
MSKTTLLKSCEITISTALKRLTKLEGLNKRALEGEFKEWISAINSDSKYYDILYLIKLKK